MIDKQLIQQKTADIKGYLDELSPLLKEGVRRIIDDNLKLRAVERLFQLIVDTAIDINTHIITRSGFSVPDDYYSTFTELGKNKVLGMYFAQKIAGSVGLRNVLVHKYGEIDLKRMIDDIKNNISDYIEYLKQIEAYLDSSG